MENAKGATLRPISRVGLPNQLQEANLSLQVNPSPSSSLTSDSDSARLSLTADFPISGSLRVKYSQTGSSPSQVLDENTAGNYAYVGTGGLGAAIQVLGFHDASLVLDRTPAPGGTWDTQTLGAFSYNLTTSASLSVIVFTGDQSGARVRLDEMPARVSASMTLMERPGNYTGNLVFSNSDTTPLKLQFIDGTRVVANLNASMPESLTGNFGFGSDDVGDPQGWLSYTASDSLPEIRFIGTDAGGNVTHVFLNGVPWQFEGSFTGTSCGFTALTNTPSNTRIDCIWFNLAPNETAGGGMSSSGHVMPGCPTSKGSDTTKDPGTTAVDVSVRGVPGGKLNAWVGTGKAGRAIIDSDAGPIESVAVTINTNGGDSPSTLTLSAKNVALKAGEWDLDGDNRYFGKPKYLYLDTGGVYVQDLRLRYDGIAGCDDAPASVDVTPGAPIMLRGFQLRITNPGLGNPKCGELGFSLIPRALRTGDLCYDDPDLTPLHVKFDSSGPTGWIARNLVSFEAQQPYPTPAGCPYPSLPPPT